MHSCTMQWTSFIMKELNDPKSCELWVTSIESFGHQGVLRSWGGTANPWAVSPGSLPFFIADDTLFPSILNQSRGITVQVDTIDTMLEKNLIIRVLKLGYPIKFNGSS